ILPLKETNTMYEKMSSSYPKSSTEEEYNRTPIIGPTQTRRKGAGIKEWLVVTLLGQTHLEEVGKHSIMKRTGLPGRDLRSLDPILSYPSTILGRERAIVINLEHIKAIITAAEVLVLNFKDPLVVPFIHDFQCRILESNETSSTNADTDDSNCKNSKDVPAAHGTRMLPFEFRALEACLVSACKRLESETLTLEQEAYPALDELTSKISTLNLERVRQIKSRLVAISGRVQKVRDELEHLLDDDNDMAEMYLTDKLAIQPLEQSFIRDDELPSEAYDADDERVEDTKTENTDESISGLKLNVEELEMLLEAYFAQIDGTLQKLSTMREYVDDTEDYINIMLDDKQNQLLQMGVVLTTANMVFNAGIVVVGLFGMNIEIPIFSGQPIQFWTTTYGTIGGCLLLYFIAIGWGKTKGLLS
ncbi:hypothetical protein IFM89_001751, partial [Coptis chinensis]